MFMHLMLLQVDNRFGSGVHFFLLPKRHRESRSSGFSQYEDGVPRPDAVSVKDGVQWGYSNQWPAKVT